MTYYSCSGNTPQGIAPVYYIKLIDQSGATVAIFDQWESLSFTKVKNAVGNYELSFVDNGDARFDMFELDGQIQVYRSVPGSSLGWYREFVGLHRKHEYRTEQSMRTFTSIGVDLNDFLSRTLIGYHGGTIYSDKNAPAETAIKQYVDENCGVIATVANTRHSEGTLPGFIVDTDGANGTIWKGSHSCDNLLDVISEIAELSKIDFNVEYNGPAQFIFKTYVNQIGSDRTTDGLVTSSGKNVSENTPVIFSLEQANVQDLMYSLDRINESNVAYILGKGDGATRTIVVRKTGMDVDSPWNRREVSRAGANQDYQYQLEQAGDDLLAELSAKDVFEFQPLQRPKSLYGKDYFFGDKITIKYKDIAVKNQRITGVTVTVSENKETIELTLEDYNG